jgi:hypothetical protein
MKHTAILLMVTALVFSVAYTCPAQNAQAGKQSQTIVRAGSQPSSKGPAEYFTGNVTVTPLFPADASASYSGAYVTFEAGPDRHGIHTRRGSVLS